MSEKKSYSPNSASVEQMNNFNSLDCFKTRPGAIITCINGVDNLALEPDVPINGKTKVRSLSRSISQMSTVSQKSKTRFSDNGDDNPRSWWYAFCLKCRSKKSTPDSWEPKYWSALCPYPFCPDYGSFARLLALIVIGVISWCVLFTIVGQIAAPPSGKLFQLLILCLGAKFGGWLTGLTTLPGLIGMLFTGILMQNVNIVDIDASFFPITKQLRKIALVIILIRAGLDLNPSALNRLKYSVVKVGLGPWFVEAIVVAIMSHYFLNLPWDYAAGLGSIAAAVSPAVTVPCLLRLRIKGYGVAKGIPTLIIAIAGIDDAASVAVFGIIKSVMFSTGSVVTVILQAPVSIVGGIGFGILWGLLCHFTPERNDPYVGPLRILLLLVGCLIAVFGSEYVGYGGAGPLGCVSAAFSALVVWSRQGWDIEDNPASEGFEILWMFFEPILFGVTGAQIKLNELDGHIVLIGLGVLIAATVIRIAATILLGIGCGLNLKEKIFSAFALMSKATVQAALGPVMLGLTSDKTSAEYVYAENILMVCILSIMLTAPTSAILMTILGPYLLTKTTVPLNCEEMRRSRRLSTRSLRDLTVENEKSGDIEKTKDLATSDQGFNFKNEM